MPGYFEDEATTRERPLLLGKSYVSEFYHYKEDGSGKTVYDNWYHGFHGCGTKRVLCEQKKPPGGPGQYGSGPSDVSQVPTSQRQYAHGWLEP